MVQIPMRSSNAASATRRKGGKSFLVYGAGKSSHRRLYALETVFRSRNRTRFRTFSKAQGTTETGCRNTLGRGAADARDRPGARGAAEATPARRALHGTRAEDRRANPRDDRVYQQVRCYGSIGRAKCRHGFGDIAPWLCIGNRRGGPSGKRQ